MLIRETQDQGYPGGISQLKAYLRELKPQPAVEPLVRFETAPGEQMQVHFVVIRRGRDRLSAFDATLGYSRLTFVYFVTDERIETVLACLRRTFEAFGGVPKHVLFDNMKTVVLERDAYGDGHRNLPVVTSQNCIHNPGVVGSSPTVATNRRSGRWPPRPARGVMVERGTRWEAAMTMKNLHRLRCAGLLMAITTAALAGTASADDGGTFDPRETFAPLILPQPVNAYRSADGSPGPSYWQNRADYQIHATLDTADKSLAAEEVIDYVNNSPNTLQSLWVQLDQNIYRKDARSVYLQGRRRTAFTPGYELDRVEVARAHGWAQATYVVSDTRMQIRLTEPLAADGGRLRVRIRYHYQLPGEFGGRTAWAETEHGVIYDVAQWYPRMAVYDDLNGWDTLPYLGSEFYLEYGDIDYYVTVPANMLVAGSGELQNPDEVLTKTQRQRLRQARSSDETVTIRGAGEVDDPTTRPRSDGTLTWHYRMENTRDVAFSASPAFVWDAARIRLPGGRKSLAMSFYPPESGGSQAWGRSTEYLKHAVEQFSRRWSVYPYPAAVNVGGKVSGMEYPGLLFDGMETSGENLFWITAHEIGHTWFPMVVGTNERRWAWMDEGLNTFIDVYESDDFENGVYGPKRDSEYAPGGGNPVEEIQSLLADREAPVIMSRADAIAEKYRHPVSYFKTALGLVLLREQILGPERFDWAFRLFIHDWSFRHPSPSDFFRTMNSAAGEDLSWFWRGWFMNQWTLDVAVQDVSYVDGDAAKGADITVANLDRLVMPVTVQMTYADGRTERVRLPAQSWLQSKTATVHTNGGGKLTSVTVDPDQVVPDRDRSNDRLTVGGDRGQVDLPRPGGG